MEILLIARNTIFNNIVRKKTNSQWGHSSVVIDDVVYDLDYKGKVKFSLSSLVLDTSISRATLFHAEMFDGEWQAEELYKSLFSICDYDVGSLSNLGRKVRKGRDRQNIQTGPGSYNCSNIIAKVLCDHYEDAGLIPEFLKDFHWSQAIPDDYSKLELKLELINNGE